MPKQPLFYKSLLPRVATATNRVSPILISGEVDECGDRIPPTTSQVIKPCAIKLDLATPRFRTKADKDAFFATLPNKVQLQLDQPFGKDNLQQCFYLQKTGRQAMPHLYKSGYLMNSDKKKLETAYPPARHFNQIVKRYRNVDFRSMKGFQPGWEQQKTLSLAQRDMTTACLIHFDFNLPAVVRWIGGPHVAEHRDNEKIFKRLKKTCSDKNYKLQDGGT
jgi:hypothetical protein